MNKLTNVLLSLILLLLVFNLVLTSKVLRQQSETENASFSASDHFDTDIARVWGEKTITLYNLQDHQSLYALFNDQAKVKISHQQLKNQLKKLHALFGDIEEVAFVNAVKLGEKGGELYFQLLFNVRVSQTENNLATLTLSVINNDNSISLYGLRLNASQSLD